MEPAGGSKIVVRLRATSRTDAAHTPQTHIKYYTYDICEVVPRETAEVSLQSAPKCSFPMDPTRCCERRLGEPWPGGLESGTVDGAEETDISYVTKNP